MGKARSLGIAIGTATALAVGAWAAGWAAESRDRARRLTECRINLESIRKAIQTKLDATGAYPQGSVPAAAPVEARSSWFVSILGGFEFGPIGFKPADASGVIRPDYTGLLPFLRCPGELNRTKMWGPGRTNYVGIGGLGVDSPTLPSNHPRAGMFGHDRTVKPSDIKDGLGQTAMVVETALEPGRWVAAGSSTTRGLDIRSKPYVGVGRQFGGTHHEGALVLFADGSVRTWERGTAPQIIEAATTIAGHDSDSR